MAKTTFTTQSLPNLHGKVFVVTGGNAGIGLGTVTGLASRGAQVYMGARSAQKAADAIKEIRQTLPDADVRFLELDLNNLSSVVAAAKKILADENHLNGLINNAGIMGTPYSLTKDGYEAQFQTNYLSHWLLTYHLLPLLQRTSAAGKPGDARIVNVSSDGHSLFPPKGGIRFDDTALEKEGGMTRYGQSKLAQVLHAKQLHKLYGPERSGEVWSGAVHPGVVHTELLNKATSLSPPIVLRTATTILGCLGLVADRNKGALSSLWMAASLDFHRSDSGAYAVPYAKIGKPSDYALDPTLADRLWTWTEDELRAKGVL